MKEGFAHSSAFQASSGIESQPAAIMSASAVLPEPRAPMIATRPGLSGMVDVFIHGASRTSIPAITCEGVADAGGSLPTCARSPGRSEEHTSELQSLMRISYAVFCLKK